jgi:hypothetical protein
MKVSTVANIGYVRVSTKEQNTDLQDAAMLAAGINKIYTDRGVSGSVAQRPELEKAIDRLEAGDTLVVWKLDRGERVDDNAHDQSLQRRLGQSELVNPGDRVDHRQLNLFVELGIDVGSRQQHHERHHRIPEPHRPRGQRHRIGRPSVLGGRIRHQRILQLQRIRQPDQHHRRVDRCE